MIIVHVLQLFHEQVSCKMEHTQGNVKHLRAQIILQCTKLLEEQECICLLYSYAKCANPSNTLCTQNFVISLRGSVEAIHEQRACLANTFSDTPPAYGRQKRRSLTVTGEGEIHKLPE